eukprot:14648649-Alexandrium_andersonii.AAC.1
MCIRDRGAQGAAESALAARACSALAASYPLAVVPQGPPGHRRAREPSPACGDFGMERCTDQ